MTFMERLEATVVLYALISALAVPALAILKEVL